MNTNPYFLDHLAGSHRQTLVEQADMVRLAKSGRASSERSARPARAIPWARRLVGSAAVLAIALSACGGATADPPSVAPAAEVHPVGELLRTSGGAGMSLPI